MSLLLIFAISLHQPLYAAVCPFDRRPDTTEPPRKRLQLSWGTEEQGRKVKESHPKGGILLRGGLYPDVVPLSNPNPNQSFPLQK